MSVPWRVAALLFAVAVLYVLLVLATHVGPSLVSARAQILAGEVPLWDGAPLLANFYLGFVHSITLLACLVNAVWLGVVLRIFAMLFFVFVLFRPWNVGIGAAIFGAVVFAFCTTH